MSGLNAEPVGVGVCSCVGLGAQGQQESWLGTTWVVVGRGGGHFLPADLER